MSKVEHLRGSVNEGVLSKIVDIAFLGGGKENQVSVLRQCSEVVHVVLAERVVLAEQEGQSGVHHGKLHCSNRPTSRISLSSPRNHSVG